MKDRHTRAVFKALDDFTIELPSWGFADTGTRFGKFFQDAAASTTEEKFHDAGLVHALTGACPKVGVHVLWDFQSDQDPREVRKMARAHGIQIGSINPNVFQDSHYKLGSFCSPQPKARAAAMAHTLESVKIGRAVSSKALTMWIADGTNYPGQDNFARRKHDLQKAYRRIHGAMQRSWPGAKLLIEYKPFEPSFYHTDIADWGTAYVLAKHAGPRAKVLVDTGHHLQGTNVEHIVSILLDENMLGGFHFNDRKYADDDLTMGSIDPYAVFRIFDQIAQYGFDTGRSPDIDYMVDQSHNLKPKLEAMVQTVMDAQTLYAKAHLVDRKALARAQAKGDIVLGERLLRDAFETDTRPMVAAWRRQAKLPPDPLEALRSSGTITRLGRERAAARRARGEAPATSYA